MSGPLEWTTIDGAEVGYHLDRVHSIAQTLCFTRCELTDNNTIPLLMGMILDEVNQIQNSLDTGEEK